MYMAWKVSINFRTGIRVEVHLCFVNNMHSDVTITLPYKRSDNHSLCYALGEPVDNLCPY